MKAQTERHFPRWILLLALLVMFAVNALATMLPLNGLTPQAASARYPNLFVPAPYVFSIWGVIYLLVIAYLLYAFGLFRKKDEPANEDLLKKVGVDFVVTCVLNAAWLIAWHYGLLILSICIIVLYLLTLISIQLMLTKEPLSKREALFVRLPFSVYFGWLTVATIANATALFVAYGFGGLGIPEASWTIIILAVGAIIGIMTALRFRNPAYLAVFIWAYAGVLQNHLQGGSFGGAYPGIIVMASLSLAAFAAVFLALLIKRKPLSIK